MTAATTLFGQSELALSAYASLASGISVSLFRKALEDVGFTTSQSDSYVSSWRVIEQYNGEPIPVLDEFNQATGEYAESDALSVTVFEEVATGRRYLAVRGTQSLSDVWTDIVDISILGTSAHQAQYASLKAKVQSWLANGTLSPGFTVTGHSLGGFLAGALLADFRSQIEHAYLYNAPGVGGVAATLTQAVQTLLGHPIDVIDLVKVSNLRADAGISPIAGLGAAWGIPVLIAIENQLAVADAPAALNHSQQVIVDALAVHALLAKMDATVTLEAIGAMLKASSSIAGNTLESVVAVVGKLLDKRYSPVATTREDLYAHLAELHTAIVGRTFTIVSLVNWTAAELKAVALDPDMVATRYALRELNPFVVLGADYSRFKLDLVNEFSGEGDLSANWIEDRATMLAKVIQTNLADGSNTYVDTSLTSNWSFVDRSTGQVIHVDRTTNTPTEDLRRQIVFGTDTDNARTGGADILTGGALADRLYGMSGIDVLQGLGGNDHLEAGKDDDLLLGGTGDDILNGGSGYDSYVWTSTPGHFGSSSSVFGASNDGDDTLLDADKLGRIVINGSGVKLLVKDGDVWKSPDGKLTLAQTDGRWKLAIAGGGSLDLGETFNDGHYGIHRLETAPGGINRRGDLKPMDTDPNTDGDQIGYDSLGNVEVTTIEQAGRNDRLYGGETDDTLRGLAGSDILVGGRGNDTLWADTPPATATPLVDALTAGETGSAQGGRGDFLNGQDNDDILVGSAARDLLVGGQGRDLLIGGAGNDMLWGDGIVGDPADTWEFSFTKTTYTVNDITYTYDPAAGDDDALYGGAGDDMLAGLGGNDLLEGGIGDDALYGGNGKDVLLGSEGNDYLNAGAGDTTGGDWLDGGAGDDELIGSDMADILIGGSGNDTLNGGAGRDTYFVSADGKDRIVDPDRDSIVFIGDGVVPGQIKLRKGSLLLDFGNGAELHIDNFDAADPLSNASVEAFQFADGSSLTWEELLAKGFDLDGTDFDDSIEGTGVADRIDGRAGNDLIWGMDGDDVITGGTGTDWIDGGLGDDSYIVHAGDAPADFDLGLIEAIVDDGGNDTLILDGIDPASVQVSGAATPNELRIAFGSDQLAIVDGIAGTVEHVTLGNETLTTAELIGRHAETVLIGTDAAGHALTLGGRRNDALTALAGHATFSGGRGNDVLIGGGGNNTYRYSLGDGTDSLTDGSAKTDAQGAAQLNTLKVGAGVTAQDLRIRAAEGVLILQIGADPDDAIHIQGFDPASETGALDRIEFDDGTTLTYAELIARGTDVIGTAGDDLLIGTNVHDRLIGGAGNDTYRLTTADDATDEIIEAENQGIDTVESAIDHSLAPHVENLLLTGNAITATGNALDNTLAGNALDNVLTGGEGSDTYRFARQSGNDLLIDGGANRIALDAGLSLDDLAASRDGDDLLLAIRRDTGSVRVQGYFTDGTPWQVSDAEGNGSTTETLLADTAAYEEDRITTLARDFLADTRLAIEENLTAQGLVRQANGTWARATLVANNLRVTQTEEFTTTTLTGRFNNGVVAWTSTGTSHDVHWTQPGGAYRSQTTASILQSRVSAGGAEVHALGARHRLGMRSRRWRDGEQRTPANDRFTGRRAA
jgi:Ca2+-binding RTX toxin-like protein